jgi:hypothetical protein
MWIAIVLVALILLLIIYEFRLKKPDQLILYESAGKIVVRKGRFYPRHVSLVLPKTIYSLQLNIDATTKGNLDMKVKLSLSVALSMKYIDRVITSGGWNSSAVQNAAKQLETIIESIVREHTERHEVEELSSAKIYEDLSGKLVISQEKFGLEVISITIQSFEMVDPEIADAIRQQESARILEQTEELNQKARIAAEKARLRADEEIAIMEHSLSLKKYELQKTELETESRISETRVKDELKRKKMQLEFEKDELAVLKNNPELLILTPQAARLAEASQTLKNARTIVSLSPNDISQNSELVGMFQYLLQSLTASSKEKKDSKQ